VAMEKIEVGGIAVETLIAGDGPPLLFLHGGDYVAQNQLFLDRLAKRFRVVMPRHPGFGNTPRPTWFRTVGDIAYLYLDLLDRLDLRNVMLAGSSFGGWVALEIAVRSKTATSPISTPCRPRRSCAVCLSTRRAWSRITASSTTTRPC
jgi:pimeloyl-ACP methyl ester carboxylesterase